MKIAAIGTLADVVPLVGENRVIAKLGLQMLTKGPHKVGLRALLEAAGLTGKTIDSYHIGFMVAPRINAAGRMSTPDIATRLLLASDEAMADEAQGAGRAARDARTPAAGRRSRTSSPRRRRSSRPIPTSARAACWSWPARAGTAASSASSPRSWSTRSTGPAIVLSIDGDIAHGSCRSIPGFDMLAALESCAPMLERFGGHKQRGRPAARERAHQGIPPGGQRARRRAASARTICGRGCGSTARWRSATSPIA